MNIIKWQKKIIGSILPYFKKKKRTKEEINSALDAIRRIDKESVNRFLTKKVDKDNTGKKILAQISLLSIAVEENNLDALKILLEKGADPNGQNREGYSYYTPISRAMRTLRGIKQMKIAKEIFKELILAGADINDKGLNGKTLLTNLIEEKKIDKDNIFYILAKGADPNTPQEFLPLNSLINSFCKTRKLTEQTKEDYKPNIRIYVIFWSKPIY